MMSGIGLMYTYCFLCGLIYTGLCGELTYYLDQKETWVQAISTCNSIGKELVKIEDSNELNRVMNYVNENGGMSNEIWIGLFYAPSDRQWYWQADDSVATYFNWRDGEPSGLIGHGGDKEFAKMTSNDFEYESTKGRDEYDFICEEADNITTSTTTTATPTTTPTSTTTTATSTTTPTTTITVTTTTMLPIHTTTTSTNTLVYTTTTNLTPTTSTKRTTPTSNSTPTMTSTTAKTSVTDETIANKTENTSNSDNGTISTAAVLGGAVGGVVALGLASLTMYRCLKTFLSRTKVKRRDPHKKKTERGKKDSNQRGKTPDKGKLIPQRMFRSRPPNVVSPSQVIP